MQHKLKTAREEGKFQKWKEYFKNQLGKLLEIALPQYFRNNLTSSFKYLENLLSLYCLMPIHIKHTCIYKLFLLQLTVSKVNDRSWGQPEGSFFNSYYAEVYGKALLLPQDCSTLLTLDIYLILLNVKQIPFLKSFVWRDLGLKPGLPDHWRTLFQINKAILNIHNYHIIKYQVFLCNTNDLHNYIVSKNYFCLRIIIGSH